MEHGRTSRPLTEAPATATADSAITGFADSLGDHVFYIASNQHVYQLYYAFSSRAWLGAEDLTSGAGGALAYYASYQGLTAFGDKLGEHLVYIGCSPSAPSCAAGDYHIYQLFYNLRTRSWGNGDLTEATGGVIPIYYSSLTAFADSLGEHIFFQGTNYHIYQLYYSYSSNSWLGVEDLTEGTDGVLPEYGAPLTSFEDSIGEHVAWEDTNYNLHQLYYSFSTRTWSDQNLSSAAGLPSSYLCSFSPLASMATSGDEYISFTFSGCTTGSTIDTGMVVYNGSVWSAVGLPGNNSRYFSAAGQAGLHNDFLYYAYDTDLEGDPLELTTVSVTPTGVTDSFIQTCCGVSQPSSPDESAVLAFIDP